MTSGNIIGLPFIELASVDSTNNYAMGLIHAGMAQHGTVVFAHEQKKGKGQRQKEWISAAGENIMLSIIIRPFSSSIVKQFLLSMSIANGVHAFFSKYAGDQTKIKWPNDIYWNDRKAGGILIENQVQGKVWKYAIAGIGININQTSFPPSAGKAVSLKQVTGKELNIIDASRELIHEVGNELNLLLDAPCDVSKRYHQALYKWNELQEFRVNNKTLTARVEGVTDGGYLVATHNHKEYFKTGELEWIIT